MKQSHYTLIALVLMIIAFSIATLFYNSGMQQKLDEHAADNNALLLKDYAVRAGDPAARVTLVEFMDPACGTCARFYPFVKQLMQQYQGKLKLVIRFLPFHPGSDKMVAILQAARKQDRFWQVLELMFASQSQWTVDHIARPEIFFSFLEQDGVNPGVNVDQIRQDMQDPGIQVIIRQDLADGDALGADKTPAFYVNGKPLVDFGFRQLQALVDEEVQANY